MKKIILSLFVFVSVIFADTNNELFAEANRLYDERNFDSAIVLYMQILENNEKTGTPPNSAVLYNISNSAYRVGNIGKAILFLERAKLLAPNNRDIAANLDFLRRQTVDRFEIPEKSFAEQIFDYFQNLIRLETQIIIIIILSFLITAILGFTLFSPRLRTLKIYTMMILFLITLILGISAGAKYNTKRNTIRGVIMAESINAVNEPRGSKTIFNAHAGTVLNIISSEGNWYFVSLPNGVSGWVQKQFVEII